jgi:hypothetical protein
MYFDGVPVQVHTSLLSVVVFGVRVTIEPEVGAVPLTMICPEAPMVAPETRPVLEMVIELIHFCDHDPMVCMPSDSAVLAEAAASTSSETRARTV